MRLTLRTLLAWLDDTLPPSQVREIGNQVSESPFAQELVERIRRVTRQRRLTIPRSSGPQSIDPNLEASYLDNDLDADQVAEVEKQCLSIDVCLAEVASVHQILSLLGQRAKVPREVKERMYQLVKGREAIPSRHLASKDGSRAIPLVSPIQPWLERESTSHSRRERYALLAGSLACFVVLGTSAWYGLSVPSSPTARMMTPADSTAEGPDASPTIEPDRDDDLAGLDENPGNRADPAMPKEVAESATPEEVATTATPKLDVAAKGPAAAGPPHAASAPLPPGAVGRTEKGDNVLLRFSDEKREWERLVEPTTLNPTDRLVCLAPFRATLDLSSMGLEMLEGSEIRLSTSTAEGRTRFEPIKGRLKAMKTPRGSAFVINLAGKDSVGIELTGADSIGIERLSPIPSDQLADLPSAWAIYCREGSMTVTHGDQKKSIDAPSVITVNAAGTLEVRAGQSPPAWVGEADLKPADRQARDLFLGAFHPGRPILAEIVTATEDSQEQIRHLAIVALATLGDLSYVMPLLDRKDGPAIRREAIAALRGFMALGPEATRQAREQILEEFGDSIGPVVEKMLIGYTPQEAADPGVLRGLVSNLEPETPSVGVRELSLDNLMRLSGRDSMGYDPDRPEGDGLASWKKLLAEGKLLPPPAPKPGDR